MLHDDILKVQHLTIKYNDITAVDDVSFSVRKNEVFGIIGSNGAGKTSLIEAIEGLRMPSSGEISVLEFNPQKDRAKMFNNVGVQLQQASYPDHAKVQDVCELFSSFYNNPVPYDRLLESFGLGNLKKMFVNKLSGGQKQKLSIVLSLLCDPKIVFWDELTTGLDPVARHDLYKKILHYKDSGLTIVLVTHFMEEIQRLCDRVALMKKGKIIAIGTPSEIVESFHADNLDEVFLKISEVNI